MSHHQELHELSKDLVGSVTNGLLKVLNKLLEHFAKNLQLNFIDGGENLNANGLVDWEELLHSRSVVS